MKIYRARLSKQGILSIPEQERRLFLALAHLQNEIRFLTRAVLWSSDFSSQNEAEVHGQTSLSFFFCKLLAGKLREGWELLQSHYFNNRQLSTRFHAQASPDLSDSLKELGRYFAKGNLLHEVRNDFAFHYSPSDLDSELGDTPDELDLYVEEGTDANTLYYFAEVLANRAVLRRVNLPELPEAMTRFNKELTDIATRFSRFNNAVLSYIAAQHKSMVWKEGKSEIEFQDLPTFVDVRFPWFADTSKGLR